MAATGDSVPLAYVGPASVPGETDEAYQARLMADFAFVYALPVNERNALFRARGATSAAPSTASVASGKGPAAPADPPATSPAPAPAMASSTDEVDDRAYLERWAAIVPYNESISHYENMIRLVEAACAFVRESDYRDNPEAKRVESARKFFKAFELAKDEAECLENTQEYESIGTLLKAMEVAAEKLSAREALRISGGVMCVGCRSDYAHPRGNASYCATCIEIYQRASLGRREPFTDPMGSFLWTTEQQPPEMQLYVTLVLASAGFLTWNKTSMTREETSVFNAILPKFGPNDGLVEFANRFARVLSKRRHTKWRSISDKRSEHPTFGFTFHALQDALEPLQRELARHYESDLQGGQSV